MNTKPTALVWFTGVISQYNLSDTNLDNLKINYSILRTLEEKYNLIIRVVFFWLQNIIIMWWIDTQILIIMWL